MNGVTEGDFVYSDATKHNLIAYLGTGGAVTIPNNVNTIGSYAFSYCNGLVSVNIPDSVTEIGSYAFAYCSALTSVTIGSGVTSIGVMAFRNCSSLISITIPNSVTSINNFVFDSCISLTTVTIGDSVTRIGNNPGVQRPNLRHNSQQRHNNRRICLLWLPQPGHSVYDAVHTAYTWKLCFCQ